MHSERWFIPQRTSSVNRGEVEHSTGGNSQSCLLLFSGISHQAQGLASCLLLPTLLWAVWHTQGHLWLAWRQLNNCRAVCLLPFSSLPPPSKSWHGPCSPQRAWSSFFSKMALSQKCCGGKPGPAAPLLALSALEVPGRCARNTPYPQRLNISQPVPQPSAWFTQ